MASAPSRAALDAFAASLRVRPGSRPRLGRIDPESTPGFAGDEVAARAELDQLRDRLRDFQERLWAERTRGVLVVLQALDAGGKDGVIRNVISAMNPQGVAVTGFGVPTVHELDHDFLWRIHAATPSRGRVGVFNRSHYEDVLVVRVDELVPPSVWRARYEQINDFERGLVAGGTTIIKLMLHISRAEQKRRFEDRLADPTRHWKWDSGDLGKRAQWDDYRRAYEDAVARCSTDLAPWYVVPADRKWYRDLAVARILCSVAARMNPRWPKPAEDLARIRIPD